MNDPPDQNASLPPNVITPKYIKNSIFGVIDQLYADGWIENPELTKAQCAVSRDPLNMQRVNIQLGIDSIDVLAQCSIIIDQVG
jgi:phage tail sheath gpL-like